MLPAARRGLHQPAIQPQKLLHHRYGPQEFQTLTVTLHATPALDEQHTSRLALPHGGSRSTNSSVNVLSRLREQGPVHRAVPRCRTAAFALPRPQLSLLLALLFAPAAID